MTPPNFDRMWSELASIGRNPTTSGYERFAWSREDAILREWFTGEARALGLDVVDDRNGNRCAWWGDCDATPGVLVGSHLDSVPDGGAYDGPLGIVSALLAVHRLQQSGTRPTRPVGIACFADEEGARFGVACAGSRLLTGALDLDRALGLTDADGTTMADAMTGAGFNGRHIGRDDEALRRIDCFVELHVEQGKGLVDLDSPVAVATSIWPHGRYRFEIAGQANHAGTTPLDARHDAMLGYAEMVLQVRELAAGYGVLATCGKVQVQPNGVNAIASKVTGWLDVRGETTGDVHAFTTHLELELPLVQESWTNETRFDVDFSTRVSAAIGDDVPRLATGAGHDAGILAAAGIPTAMLFVRNPTGISHSPYEHAERDDCLAGIDALTAVLRDLVG